MNYHACSLPADTFIASPLSLSGAFWRGSGKLQRRLTHPRGPRKMSALRVLSFLAQPWYTKEESCIFRPFASRGKEEMEVGSPCNDFHISTV